MKTMNSDHLVGGECGGVQGHTPGPYIVCDVGDYGDYDGRCSVILSCDSKGDVDMRVAVVLGDSDESKATAKLFGASPKLLRALQAVLSVADRATVEFDLARSAIAKATGAA